MASSLRSCLPILRKSIQQSAINSPIVQAVRFRKPGWVPISKSKEFYVRKPTPIDPEEHAELENRYKHYRAAVRGVRYYLRQQLSKQEEKTVEIQESDEAADFAWMEAELKQWNKSIAAQREQRQADELQQEEERIHQVMQKLAEDRLQRSIEAEKLLQINKEASANFVTMENLDEEIEKMLDSRNDYNYAITKGGDILPGEYPNMDDKSGQFKGKVNS